MARVKRENRNSKNSVLNDPQWLCALANAHHTRAAALSRYKDAEAKQARNESLNLRQHYLSLAWRLKGGERVANPAGVVD